MTMYDEIQTVSSDVIKEFGVPCFVKNQGEGKYNPSTGEYIESGGSSHSAHCLFDNLAYDFSKGQDTANVQQGDVLIYLTASGQPEVNSVVEANGEQWVIINCQPIKPANTVLMYQCQGRKR